MSAIPGLQRMSARRLERTLKVAEMIAAAGKRPNMAAIARDLGVGEVTVRDDRDTFDAYGAELIRARLAELQGRKPAPAESKEVKACQYWEVRAGKAVQCGGRGYPYCPRHRAQTMPAGGNKCGAGTGASLMTGFRKMRK